ncbi:MAG: amino acid ABC transporter ATP-binding protein [Planctomycetia bacterium]|nr:amino acid ABC transporter ATP-binding protein [Planctomycetia bacterium]
MPLPPTTHVEFRGLKKRFGNRLVLDGLDLSIDVGETVALIGPSGAGKSTLLRCLNGLTHFEAGEIRIGDELIQSNGNTSAKAVRQVRRDFGMVFQDFQLFPHLTALENITEAPRQVLRLSHNAARQRGVELLTRVGLGDRTDAYPGELSGGQKQRVAVARALAMQPRGLLCDEITSALDPELKGEVLAVLEDLKRDRMTLLVVTHEIGFARRAADRIVVLADGKVIESGLPEEVLDNPKHERTRQFLRQVMR